MSQFNFHAVRILYALNCVLKVYFLMEKLLHIYAVLKNIPHSKQTHGVWPQVDIQKLLRQSLALFVHPKSKLVVSVLMPQIKHHL